MRWIFSLKKLYNKFSIVGMPYDRTQKSDWGELQGIWENGMGSHIHMNGEQSLSSTDTSAAIWHEHLDCLTERSSPAEIQGLVHSTER
jgi:hypothetical protein